ncbi:MAG: DNA translocase FtsK, partial [Deinococcales bacterium]
MASPEVSTPPSAKLKTARKRKRAAVVAKPIHTADIEAIGLILFGVAVVLGLTVFAPPSLKLFSAWQNTLRGFLGWGMYYLPFPFLVLGGLLLLKRNVGLAARVLLGVFVTTLAGLLGTAFFDPKLAGSLAVGFVAPMKVVTPLAILLIAFLGTLGLEIALGWQRTRIARAAARVTSLGMLSAASATSAAAKRAKKATDRLALQIAARRGFDSASRDIAELEKLYVGASDLTSWQREIERSSDAINEADEARLMTLRDEASEYRSRVAAFTQAKGKELAEALQLENVGVDALLTEARKQLQSPILSQNPSAKALESVRRALQLECKALEETERKLLRERDTASRSLVGSLRPFDLRLELERHNERLERNKQLRLKCEHLLTRVAPLAGWAEFVARLEQRPEPEVLAFMGNLESSLKNAGADVLPELPNWATDLDTLERRLLLQTHTQVATPQAEPIVQQEVIYNAVFDLEYPNGNHISGEDAAQLMSGLETVDIGINSEDDDAAPWVSPAEHSAQKMQGAEQLRLERAATLERNTERQFTAASGLAPGIADSGVGERLRFDPSKAVGAIPIQVPSTAFLDPIQVSGIDMVAFDRAARERGAILDETFKNFHVNARVLNFARGPTVTRFEVEPAPGEKIARIASLQNDIARVLAVGGIRIEAPVPGKSVVGIEVPNIEREPITFRTGIESKSFASGKQKLPLLLGKSIDGEMVVDDLARMPHLLIAGSTGSGKSVC